ncbi:FIVAR domain-containing protein [Clostridium perfringens]|uniref:pectate lyase-like adhesive domain-containing protein n=1 Tax=Clostridium perfringens TaxID=1502 RepID=UPI0022485853|nr:pectate lyase-like adhesive domain-containing protein [Clostridium perfringens]MCX0365374.1 FIVAR domain-containing protein [Clostridium perfringens]
MNRKKIASLILATSIVTTQVATPVFASTNDNTTNVASTKQISDGENQKDDSSKLVNSVEKSNEKDTKSSETKTVTDSTTTAVVNNTSEFMAALKNNNIKSIKLNSDVTLTEKISLTRDLDIYGENHTLNLSDYRIDSYQIIKLSFNNINLKNGYNDSYGAIYLQAKSEITFDNVNFNGPELVDIENGIINLKGNSNFTTNSIQELFIAGFINIFDNSNINIKNTYNSSHWNGCSVISTSWSNENGGVTVGNNANLNIITENNNACLGPSQLSNTNSFLKIGDKSNVVLRNEATQYGSWTLAAYNITQMDLADTATLEISADKGSWGTVYSSVPFTWNLHNANVKLSENNNYMGIFGSSNGVINFGSSTNLQDVSVWNKDNTSELANAVANDIYGSLKISGSSISSANISNPNLISSLVNNSKNGMSKLEFGVGKVDKSELEDLLQNKHETTGMTPESAKKYEDALAAGQKVFDNPNATQQEVNDAVKAIEDSSNALTPDKSGLQSAIDKATDALINGNLTPNSQQALKDAINNAKNVLKNPNATVADINSAIKDLEAATNGAVTSADKAKLEELLNNKKDTAGMTPESAKKYEDALAAGQKVFDNPNATQQEVNDAVKAIEDSSNALTPDKSGLQSAIDKATDALINGNLTPNSQQALKDAINNAKNVLKNPNATVADINSAIKDLEAATNGAVTSADKAKLEELLNNKKDTAGMTPESAKKYDDALAAGQKVFNNPNATQQEVDDAVKAIENSSSALTPDKSGLQTAIDKAKDTLGSGKLTPDSEKALKDAINKAEGVLNNPNATVSDINNVVKDLEDATSGVITSADKAKLEELLNNKASIDGKTPESIKKYEDALAAGQKVFVNPNASQKEVDDAVKAIESSLQNMNSSIASIESNFKEAYWEGKKLVFGGTFDILNTNVDKNAEKVLLIKDNNGDIVKKIGTWNASWNGNTGYQCFINAKDFEALSNGTYKLYVSTTINGASYESAVKQPKSLLRYIVHNNINDLESQRFGTTVVKFSSNSDNDVIFTKEVSALTPAVNVKTMYFNESGLVVDGNFGFQGTSLNNPIGVKLLIKDSTGNVIETIDTWKAGWGEKNTGFQGIISKEVLSKIIKGEYTLFAKANFDGKDYETKLVTDYNFKVENIINDSFKIAVNANSDSVTFEKITAVRFESQSEIKQSYWDGNSFVINGVVNIGDKELAKGDIRKLVILDSDGNQVSEVPVTSLDWFSNKGNFSGFQAIIPEALMEQLTIGTYSLEVQTTYNEVEYSNKIKQVPSLLRVFSIYKDVNDTEEKLFNNLLYKFTTDSNNNVVLNVNQNILQAQSIANNIYWQNNLSAYFINGGVTIDGKEMQPDENEHMLVLKNSDGKVVSKSSEVVQGWNEENPYQAQINSNMIDNLNPGTYTVYIRVTYDGKVYEAPIKLNSSLTLNTEKHQTDRYTVNVGLNSSKDLTITVK